MREVFACKDKGWQWSSVEEFKFQGKKNETKHENGRTGSWEIEKNFGKWKHLASHLYQSKSITKLAPRSNITLLMGAWNSNKHTVQQFGGSHNVQ